MTICSFKEKTEKNVAIAGEKELTSMFCKLKHSLTRRPLFKDHVGNGAFECFQKWILFMSISNVSTAQLKFFRCLECNIADSYFAYQLK